MRDKRNPPMLAMIRNGAAAMAVIALSGCISLSSEPPESLLTLTATASAPAGTGTAGSRATAIKVLEPETSARLSVARVPVQVDATEIAYLKDAVWVEKPSRLFRTLLAETLRTRTGGLVIDGDDPGVGAASTIRGTLREFGYDARTSSVVVRFDAIRSEPDGALQTRRFESVQPGILAEAGPVGDGLNRAANDVAGQVADWVAGG
ncbi:ABC-type transport auxiliary lipoprotein family protein [Pontixanthobacter luteolus]|uniref:ABC-type transport auxiliary lipoprotein family protein n=1 Tax=Pontixanthobacter luteolus TaxID=295089 RepID=UPI002303C9EB|nr:ABC-type transport auxiliary lipoprotein family protein [Pontixanthobacter luteolus]